MTSKRDNKTAGTDHPRTGVRRSTRAKKTDPPGRPGEHRIDESIEESFPASDPPAHRTDPDPTLHVKATPPVEGERQPDDEEGGIGGEVRRPVYEAKDDDPLERGED